jgi:hypothetical protein
MINGRTRDAVSSVQYNSDFTRVYVHVRVGYAFYKNDYKIFDIYMLSRLSSSSSDARQMMSFRPPRPTTSLLPRPLGPPRNSSMALGGDRGPDGDHGPRDLGGPTMAASSSSSSSQPPPRRLPPSLFGAATGGGGGGSGRPLPPVTSGHNSRTLSGWVVSSRRK